MMQNWIAGLLAVLGTLLVLTGATVTALQKLTPSAKAEPATGRPTVLARLRQLAGGERLLLWGVILLVICAIIAGAISFNLSASAGTR